MDWSDERYVRIYVRDTTTWKLLRFEGQTVLMHMVRKLNRFGRIELDGCTPAEVVSLHTTVPEDVAATGIERLMERGVFVVEGGMLVMPNYVEAQEAKKSEAQRKREQRERERESVDVTKPDEPVTKRDTSVTERDGLSRPVTPCPALSRNVTPSLAQPSLAQPEEPMSTSGQARDVRRVFDHWCQAMGKRADAKLTGDRRSKIQARLRDGYTVDQLCQAVDGCKVSPFHMGENDRSQAYNDITTILKSGAKVEEHIARVCNVTPIRKPAAVDVEAILAKSGRDLTEPEWDYLQAHRPRDFNAKIGDCS